MPSSAPIFVGGNLAGRSDAGGHLWALAHWADGLRKAGYGVEFIDRAEGAAAEASSLLAASDIAYTVLPEGASKSGTDLAGSWLLNVMGYIPIEIVHGGSGSSVFLDIDPGYAQIWRELGLADMLAGHDRHVTLGENIGRPGCTLPDCGLDWVTTAPPVAIDAWKPVRGGGAFTTVATWRNPYGTLSWRGDTLGSRVHEFRKFFELPRLVDCEFELALDIHAEEVDDLLELDANGWRLVDPKAVAGTPGAYRSYIQGSRAEFCVAQNIYVATRSGWLSDRSLCYLASGKPVLAQDTGFSDNYPVGEGLLAFSTLDEAAAGIEEIERNYERHSRAARELAEEYFDSAKIMRKVLDAIGAPEVSHA